MRTLTIDDVTITVHAEQDHIPVRGNAMADHGNVWAWAAVTVRATWEGPSGREYVGEDHLDACSYESEAAFKRDGYYADMVACALADLNQDLAECGEDVASLGAL